MDLMPILSTLRRHKTAALLIVLEIALTCAIVCNALHLIGNRLRALQRDVGVAENELVVLRVGGEAGRGGAAGARDALVTQDLASLRALPGVKNATMANQYVYGDNSSSSGVSLQADRKNESIRAANYMMDEQGVSTLGLKLLEGRDFLAEEVQLVTQVQEQAQPKFGQAIINRDLAQALFPGKSALGQVFYSLSDSPTRVIGVVQRLTPSQPGNGPVSEQYAMIHPIRHGYGSGGYVMRVDAAQRDTVLKAAPLALEKIDARRVVIESKRLDELRRSYDAQDRAMAWLMGGVCVALLLVTAFGIVGLASFWVQQRTRMIGTRRALGATQGQILRYFQLENFLLTSAGIVLGMVAAYGISIALMQSYELPRLPWAYLPAGALVLWALGQLAVLAPARRAAALPPVAALRA
jgi:putative ABC transport system permease protein